MPGLGLAANLTRPALSRTLSSHPTDDQRDQADAPSTPYEPLTADDLDFSPWLKADDDDTASERASNLTPQDGGDELEISLSDLPVLPPLGAASSSASSVNSAPPLEINPLGGALTRSFSSMLQDDSKFFRPVPAKAAGTATRRILAAPIPSNPKPASSRKRAAPEPAPLIVAAAPAAPTPAAAPRKKRRGMRPGTYMCLFKGELFECPHGCDIVEKGLLYDLLRRQ